MQVISFTGYTPAARFDAIPWEQARVEEGPESTGPWTVIDTLALDPVDADPAAPALRNLTTAQASDTPDLWYRLTFVDGNGDVGEPTTPIQNLAEPPAIDTTYVSLDEFKDEFAIRVGTDDARLRRALAAASEAINRECDRTFYPAAATASERFYTPERPLTLPVDDLVELTELALDYQGNGTFATVWVQPRDFVLYPLNAVEKLRPFERAKVHPYGRFGQLPKLPRSVRVTARFGWPAVPAGVTQATVLLANRLRLRKDTPYGVASFGTEVAMRLLRTDPDFDGLLDDLRRDTVIY